MFFFSISDWQHPYYCPTWTEVSRFCNSIALFPAARATPASLWLFKDGTQSYGVETDWRSLGPMLYEMAYGVAPFCANDIPQTYIRIMNHEVCYSDFSTSIRRNHLFLSQKSLCFDQKVNISHEYQHFLRCYVVFPSLLRRV